MSVSQPPVSSPSVAANLELSGDFSPRPYEIWSSNGQFAVSLDADPALGDLDFRAEAAEEPSSAQAFLRPCEDKKAEPGSADILLETPRGRLAFLSLPPGVVEQWRASGLLVVEFDDQGPLREHYFQGPPVELAPLPR